MNQSQDFVNNSRIQPEFDTMMGPPSFNDSGLISTEAKDEIFFAINCVSYPILFVFGTAGNIISILVMMIRGLKNSTNIILVALAVADTIQLTVGVVEKSPCIISRFDAELGGNTRILMYPQVMMARMMFVRITAFLTMLIAVERSIAVMMPFKAKILLSAKRIRIVVVAMYVFPLLTAVPTFLIFKVVYVANPFTNSSIAILQHTALHENNAQGFEMYLHIFNNIVMRYLPVLVVVVCSLAVVVNLKLVRIWKMNSANVFSSERIRREKKITKMGMTVTTFYLVCMIPTMIHQIWIVLDGDFDLFRRLRNSFLVISEVASLFEALNSSANFIFYVLLSEKFAETLEGLFRCRKVRSEPKRPEVGGVYSVGTQSSSEKKSFNSSSAETLDSRVHSDIP